MTKEKKARPRKKEKTMLTRIYKSTHEKMKFKMPGVCDSADRIASVYDTSVIKHLDKVDKMGEFLYGKMWKKLKK